jgi:UDP-glucose 4-epimerase
MGKIEVLVIGSEGFIGKHLISAFKDKFSVTGCDLVDKSLDYDHIKVSKFALDWEPVFNQKSFDICINVAGSANVSSSMTDPLADFKTNVSDVLGILEAIRKLSSSCKYLHFSSAAVYGNPIPLPVTENAMVDPLSPYGWHKLMSELICKEYYSIYGIQSAILRPFSVFGPGLKRQIFWDIYQKYLNNDKGQISLFGTGLESRDFIYIDDLIAAVTHIMTGSPFKANVYNIGNGIEVTIEEAATKFLQLFGTTYNLQFNGEMKSGDPKNWKADISNLSALGYIGKVSMEEGLKKYKKWLISQDLKSH